jgi:acyl-CoA synthetase (NDP forming)
VTTTSTTSIDGVSEKRGHELVSMFAPASIAIVGASSTSAWSRCAYTNLTQGGFKGEIFLVNRRGEEIYGRPSYVSLAELPAPADLALVLTGPGSIRQIIDDAALAGIKNLSLVASGFAETGAAGRELQAGIVARANENGQKLLGPNGLGHMNAWDSVHPWVQPMAFPMQPGGISFLSQSGSMGVMGLSFCKPRGIGIGHFISLGNEANLTIDEGIEFLVNDERCTVIALYVEAIRQADRFVDACRRAQQAGKPIVAYRAGRGKRGARVAAAHTGGLVSDDRLTDSIFRQLGVTTVEFVEELFVTASAFEGYAPLRGKRVGFVTASGAMCGVMSNLCEQAGVDVPELDPATVAALREVLPSAATAQNPLDVTGHVVDDPTLTAKCQVLVSNDPNVDILLASLRIPQTADDRAMVEADDRALVELSRQGRATVVGASAFSTEHSEFGQQYIRDLGLPPVLDGLNFAIRALRHVIDWSSPEPESRGYDGQTSLVPVTLDNTERSGNWSEHRAAQLLAANGVSMVPMKLATTREEAIEAAGQVGYPVVLKIAAPHIVHKSDVGGVALDLVNADAVGHAFDDMIVRVRRAVPEAAIDGVLIVPMRKGGHELLIGVVRDPVWGLVIAVADGGVMVEIAADSALRRLPITHADAQQMLSELRIAPIFEGVRGAIPVDLDKVCDLVVRLGELAVALGEDLAELELNPVRVAGAEVEGLDAIVRWTFERPEGE